MSEGVTVNTFGEFNHPVDRSHLIRIMSAPNLRIKLLIFYASHTMTRVDDTYTAVTKFLHPLGASLMTYRFAKLWNLTKIQRYHAKVRAWKASPPMRTYIPVWAVRPTQFCELAMPEPPLCTMVEKISHETKTFVRPAAEMPKILWCVGRRTARMRRPIRR